MKQIITFASFVIACAGISLASNILVPFLLAVFIAVAVSPLMAVMIKYKIPRSLAVLVLLFIFGYIFYLFGEIIGSAGVSLANDLPIYKERLNGVISTTQGFLARFGVSNNFEELISGNIERIFGSLTVVFKSTSEIVTKSFMVLLLLIFVLFEEPIFVAKLSRLGGSTNSAIHNFTANLKRYVAIKTISSIATALILLPALYYFNVPYALLLALLAFGLNYIPTVGSSVAAVPALILCLLVNEPIDTLWLSLYYIVINIAIGNFIEPRFLGKGLGISTLVVVLSLIFWGFLLGVGGMFLAVPLTMTIKLALDCYEENNFISILLSDKA